MIETCKCGRWYNTTIKCPDCNTVAKKKKVVEMKKELRHCKICNQMTNHKRVQLPLSVHYVCLKCGGNE